MKIKLITVQNRDRLMYGIILLLSAATFLFYIRYHLDDALITLRYSRNLIEGNGLVYNVGEKVQGFTSPLFCLINALLFAATFQKIELLYIANTISILSLTALMYLSYKLINPDKKCRVIFNNLILKLYLLPPSCSRSPKSHLKILK